MEDWFVASCRVTSLHSPERSCALFFNSYDMPSFHYLDCKYSTFSVFIFPDQITPVFQLIWQSYMRLMTARVDLARSGHGPRSFHYLDCKSSIFSVSILPDQITPVFQLISQCYMMLMTARVDLARLGHGPPSFHYLDCKSSIFSVSILPMARQVFINQIEHNS